MNSVISDTMLNMRPFECFKSSCRGSLTATRAVSKNSRLVCYAAADKARIAVLGASGYTGAEVMRLMPHHPSCEVVALTGESNAGKDFADVFPHLAVSDSKASKLVKIADVDWSSIDAAFCCLPHATTQEVLSQLPESVKIVDLSADFRLRDVEMYSKWYGEHKAPELQTEAVYGLTEIYRDQIKDARLVANPGCYPTCSQLPLIPLIKNKMLKTEDIIIDAKSGVSGAGRSAKVPNLYSEVTEGLHAYGVASHRHMPEIEQGLSEFAGQPVQVSFTPHLMPMSRGMLCTIYAKTAEGIDANQCREALADFYKNEYFVKVLPAGTMPQTRHVRGSNFNLIGVSDDAIPGRIIIVSVIDNLVKGASGQAIQNLNLILGFPETTAIEQLPLFP